MKKATEKTEQIPTECNCGECLECGERLSLLRVILHPGSCLCGHCEARRAAQAMLSFTPVEPEPH